MKLVSIAAIALILLGVILMTGQGVTHAFREKVIDVRPLQVAADHPHLLPLPPVRVVAVVSGVAIFWWFFSGLGGTKFAHGLNLGSRRQ